MLAPGKLHADDTPVPVLCPGRGTTKTGRLWVYVRDDRNSSDPSPPAVLFRYSPDRKAVYPNKHLQSFSGVLQADGYAGFNPLYERPTNKVSEAACWAHARRKLYDIYEATDSPIAQAGLERIAVLYQIEEQIRGKPPDERRAFRQARAGPLSDDLHRWFIETVRTLSKKSELAGAIRYALSRWTALTRYRDDGRIEIDKNSVERGIRPTKLGAKNWLYIGHPDAGWRSAVIYSITGTCKLLNVNLVDYLTWVLPRLATATSAQVDGLLPHDYAASVAA